MRDRSASPKSYRSSVNSCEISTNLVLGSPLRSMISHTDHLLTAHTPNLPASYLPGPSHITPHGCQTRNPGAGECGDCSSLFGNSPSPAQTQERLLSVSLIAFLLSLGLHFKRRTKISPAGCVRTDLNLLRQN